MSLFQPPNKVRTPASAIRICWCRELGAEDNNLLYTSKFRFDSQTSRYALCNENPCQISRCILESINYGVLNLLWWITGSHLEITHTFSIHLNARDIYVIVFTGVEYVYVYLINNLHILRSTIVKSTDPFKHKFCHQIFFLFMQIHCKERRAPA